MTHIGLNKNKQKFLWTSQGINMVLLLFIIFLEGKCFVQRIKLSPETGFDQVPQAAILKRIADSEMNINILLSKQGMFCGCGKFSFK